MQAPSPIRRPPYDLVMLVAVRADERRMLNAGLQRTLPEGIQCHPDNRHVIVTGTDSSGVSRAVLLAIANGARRTIAEVDSGLVGSLQVAVAPDGQMLVVSRTLPVKPLKLFQFDGAK